MMRLVFGVDVAVIIKKQPDMADNSPVCKDMAGLKAFLDSLPSPQLATFKEIVKKFNQFLNLN